MTKSSTGRIANDSSDWATLFAAAVLGGSLVFAGGRISLSTPQHHAAVHVVAERMVPCQDTSAPAAALVPVADVAPVKVAEAKPMIFQTAPVRAPIARRAVAPKPAAQPHAETASALASLDEPGF